MMAQDNNYLSDFWKAICSYDQCSKENYTIEVKVFKYKQNCNPATCPRKGTRKSMCKITKKNRLQMRNRL